MKHVAEHQRSTCRHCAALSLPSPTSGGGNGWGRRQVLAGLAAVGAHALPPVAGASAQDAAAAPAAKGRIDVHYHVFPPNPAGVVPRNPAQRGWTPARAIEELDRNGVATGIASSGSGIGGGDVQAVRRRVRIFNEFAAQLGRDHRDRFGLFAALPLADTDGSLQEIEYALDVLKADGVGLLTSYGDLWLGDPKFRPVFEELNRRSAVVYVHPNDAPCCVNLSYQVPPVLGSWIEWPMQTARAILSLMINRIPLELPGIRFIFAHDGGAMPMMVGRIAGLGIGGRADFRDKYREMFPNGVEAEYRKLYFDTAQGYHPVNMAAMRALVPESHILFGSDYPYHPIANAVSGLQQLDLPPALVRAIVRENAEALFPRWKA